jgi:hypothetical protein
MMWLETVHDRNAVLFWFGTVNLVAAVLFLVAARFSDLEVAGANAWFKPFKFAVSIGVYSWTMAWFVHYLQEPVVARSFSWGIVVLLGFEIVYIAFMAAKGQQSHFNVSSPFFNGLYMLMAFAATAVALWTAYIGVLFMSRSFPDLPNYYVHAIRWGIFIFVIFSFEGFVMGSRLAHTIGGSDGGPGLPVVGWSTKFGDPRVAHFIGMHALQVLPILAYFILKDVRLIGFAALIYLALAAFTLWQALQGNPLIRSS